MPLRLQQTSVEQLTGRRVRQLVCQGEIAGPVSDKQSPGGVRARASLGLQQRDVIHCGVGGQPLLASQAQCCEGTR